MPALSRLDINAIFQLAKKQDPVEDYLASISNEGERWKRICLDDVDTMYYISDFGRITNVKNKKILNPYLKNCKFSLLLYHLGKSYYRSVHRLVAEAFVFNPDKTKLNCVIHLDKNKQNNHYKNLGWTSLDKVPRINRSTKYTEQQVDETCRLMLSGKSIKEIVKLTGVDECVCALIKMGRAWKYISKKHGIV